MSKVNQLDEKKKKSMKSRIIVGLILALVGFPCMIVGSWFYLAFITFFFIFAIYEFVHASQKKYHWFVWVFTFFICISYYLWAFVKSNLSAYLADPASFQFSLEEHFVEPGISWVAMISALGVYFIIGLFHKDFDIFDIAYLFAMSVLVSVGFQCMLFLRYHPLAVAGAPVNDNLFRWVTSSFLFFFVLCGTFGNDIMAYFVGVFFGKHKMSQRVSPNKSWEGFFGGWILGGAIALVFAIVTELCGHPMLHAVHFFGEGNMWWAIVILSFTLPLIGVLGDLTLSLIKRYFGIKDYGTLLAAHGGVLDRADSLLFCCIFASILLVLFEKQLGFFA